MSLLKNKEEEKKNESNEINNNNIIKDATELSIKQALRRKRISVVKPKEDQILDLLKEDFEDGLKVVRNPKLLLYFLLNTQDFKQYIYINRFSYENLINSFRLGKYVVLKKDTILFKQGDKTDKFYLVLSGCIGFILTTYEDNILKTNPYSREVNSIRVGAYFGEWGLIYKITRTVTAFAKENTLLLGFDRKTFRTLYQNNIVYTENNIKKFVLKHIKTFKDLNEASFNIYYREIKKIYCIQGKEIFHEGGDADSFYLVYMGSCSVKKGLTTIIIKDSGDFIGIESLFKKKYETTIFPYAEGTVLFKFLLDSISSNIVANLKSEFIDYYKTQNRIIKTSSDNYNKYKTKYQMNFINLIENIKKNKLENNIRGNNVKLDELHLEKEKELQSKDKIASPYKNAKISKLKDFNNKNLQNNTNNNRIESAKLDILKVNNFNEEFPNIKNIKSSSIESHKKNFNSNNTSNPKIETNLQKRFSRNTNLNDNINKNITNDFNNKKIRPYSSSLRIKNNFSPNITKNKINFFYKDNKTYNLRIINNMKKTINKNHFSYKNILLKENKQLFPLSTKNKLNRNNSTIDEKWIFDEKKFFKYIYEKNTNMVQKMGKKINFIKNNNSHSDKKNKNKKKNESKKIDFNNNLDSNAYEIPLMIIRNLSYYSNKLK